MRILVTGGAGFIGSAAVRQLIRETDADVINVDKLTYADNLDSLAEAAQSPRHVFERVDIVDAAEVARLFEQHRPSAVIHLAAESPVDRSIDGPGEFIRTNVVGTFTLLHAATGYWKAAGDELRRDFRFLHVSTDEVFGSLGPHGHFTEETPYRPNSPYSASKAGSDHLVRAWHHTYGLPTVVTNCSNNYGPYQFPEKLIPLFLFNALEGRPLPVYGTTSRNRAGASCGACTTSIPRRRGSCCRSSGARSMTSPSTSGAARRASGSGWARSSRATISVISTSPRGSPTGSWSRASWRSSPTSAPSSIAPRTKGRCSGTTPTWGSIGRSPTRSCRPRTRRASL